MNKNRFCSANALASLLKILSKKDITYHPRPYKNTSESTPAKNLTNATLVAELSVRFPT